MSQHIPFMEGIADFPHHTAYPPLRPYQIEIAQAILQSIQTGAGHTFTVLLARQMGKNELSAQLEAYLLHRHQATGGTIVKGAPTFRPQLITSRLRLLRLLGDPGNDDPGAGGRRHKTAHGYIVSLGQARVLFLSAGSQSHIVGATADLLLEIDEAQDVDEEKFLKEFRPMAATTNATTVLYGTAWTQDTLLAKQQAINLEMQRRDGIQRHFQFDWRYLAALNPRYERFVLGEIERLGADHPTIRTQYELQTIEGETRFFSPTQLAQLQGTHAPEEVPGEGIYVAGLDIAGEDEHQNGQGTRLANPRRDSTVLTIGRLVETALGGGTGVEVVHHEWWTGRDHQSQYLALLDLIRTWNIRRIAVDATGIGEAIASFLEARLGDALVDAVKFSRASKSQLGYKLLEMVNTGRLKMHARTSRPVDREAWAQFRQAKRQALAGTHINFFVEPSVGHDDFLASLALLAHAGDQWAPPDAHVVIRPRPLYADESRYGL